MSESVGRRGLNGCQTIYEVIEELEMVLYSGAILWAMLALHDDASAMQLGIMIVIVRVTVGMS